MNDQIISLVLLMIINNIYYIYTKAPVLLGLDKC